MSDTTHATPKLGDRVRDRVTGFEGVITVASKHLFGCTQFAVKSPEVKDGKPIDAQWFDEGGLEIVEVDAIVPSPREPIPVSGPERGASSDVPPQRTVPPVR